MLLLWTISNPHSSFTRLEDIFSTFNFSSFYWCHRHLDCHSKKYYRLMICNNRNLFLTVLEAGSLTSGCCMVGFKWRLSELQVADFLLYPHMVGVGGMRELFRGLHSLNLIILKGPTSWHYPLGIKWFSTYELRKKKKKNQQLYNNWWVLYGASYFLPCSNSTRYRFYSSTRLQKNLSKELTMLAIASTQ